MAGDLKKTIICRPGYNPGPAILIGGKNAV